MEHTSTPAQKVILVVEDEVALAAALSDEFVAKGYSVSIAEDGEKALSEAFRLHPDMITLDIVMPKMDGMKFLETLRKDPWGATVPVIILTNLSADTDTIIQDVIEGKPLYYFVKSDWRIGDIVDKVSDIFAGKA